jgi:hypothetical protein
MAIVREKVATPSGLIHCCQMSQLTIAGKDGADAPLYMEKEVKRVLEKLKQLEEGE